MNPFTFIKPMKTESPGYGYLNDDGRINERRQVFLVEIFGVVDQFREAVRQCAFDAQGTSEHRIYEYGADLLDAVRKHLVQETASTEKRHNPKSEKAVSLTRR